MVLQQAQKTFIEKLETNLELIADMWVAVLEAPEDASLVLVLKDFLHAFSDEAESLHFDFLSAKSLEVMAFLQTMLNAPNYQLRPESESQITYMFHELVVIARQEETLEHHATPNMRVKNNRILVVEEDIELLGRIEQQLNSFGFEVLSLNVLDNLSEKQQRFDPCLMIVSTCFNYQVYAGMKAVQAVQQVRAAPVPVIFISKLQDFKARLAAVRAGGKAFLPKPLNFVQLLSSVNELTQMETSQAPKVLVVDDDAILGQFISSVLVKAGIRVEVVSKPMDVFSALAEFEPDLILLDQRMPECTGVELAKVIRQEPRYLAIPIIFLTADKDVDFQFEAMLQGGDDFLSKPVQADKLIALIATKIKRVQKMVKQMVNDCLTGLYNHNYVERLLEKEIARSDRMNRIFSVALIDIDHLKKINCEFGHETGDSVLRNLSCLLENRLRLSDVIGRFSSDQFILILSDTDLSGAYKVVDEIRQAFSQIQHQSLKILESNRLEDKWFYATFRAGAVEYVPNSKTKEDLVVRLERLLDKAARKGRNRVVLEQ